MLKIIYFFGHFSSTRWLCTVNIFAVKLNPPSANRGHAAKTTRRHKIQQKALACRRILSSFADIISSRTRRPPLLSAPPPASAAKIPLLPRLLPHNFLARGEFSRSAHGHFPKPLFQDVHIRAPRARLSRNSLSAKFLVPCCDTASFFFSAFSSFSRSPLFPIPNSFARSRHFDNRMNTGGALVFREFPGLRLCAACVCVGIGCPCWVLGGKVSLSLFRRLNKIEFCLKGRRKSFFHVFYFACVHGGEMIFYGFFIFGVCLCFRACRRSARSEKTWISINRYPINRPEHLSSPITDILIFFHFLTIKKILVLCIFQN